MNFTGQHRCFIQNELSDMIGLIVSSSGNYINIDNEKISVDELSKHNKNWLMEYMEQ